MKVGFIGFGNMAQALAAGLARRVLGYLPQDFGYYPNFTGLDFLLYLSALKGLDRRGAEARSRELLELVGLSEAARKRSRPTPAA